MKIYHVSLFKQQQYNRINDINVILDIAIQIVSAVKHIHDSGFIHGDINAHNILLSKDLKDCALIDFGMSIKQGCTFNQLVPMPRAYSPPDIVKGTPLLPSSEIWSVGALLFSLLTGRLFMTIPSNATNDCENLHHMIYYDNYTSNTTLDDYYYRMRVYTSKNISNEYDKMARLISRCFYLEADKRPTADELLVELCTIRNMPSPNIPQLAPRKPRDLQTEDIMPTLEWSDVPGILDINKAIIVDILIAHTIEINTRNKLALLYIAGTITNLKYDSNDYLKYLMASCDPEWNKAKSDIKHRRMCDVINLLRIIRGDTA